MKKQKDVHSYESPDLEIVEIQTEAGFTLSSGDYGGSTEDMGDLEEFDWEAY